MNALERTEYVVLRLIRRFVVNERTARRFAHWLPYYTPSVNEAEPALIVNAYARALGARNQHLRGKRVLEVGSGRTNVVAYGLAATGAADVTALEPYVPFDAQRDHRLRSSDPALSAVDWKAVRRVTRFSDIPDASIDVLVSNSVLEHVLGLRQFFSDCRRVLAPGGSMLHLVDYRDHFFKYPYAFLTFSDKTWSRWLDPGDLPRWRLADHLAECDVAGFKTEVLSSDSNQDAFASIKPRLAGRFASAQPGVEITTATLLSWIAT